MLERKFMILSFSEINQINFNEILETSIDTLRLSTDGTKTFVKWDDDTIPPSVNALTTKEGPYTYEEMLDILETPAWSGI